MSNHWPLLNKWNLYFIWGKPGVIVPAYQEQNSQYIASCRHYPQISSRFIGKRYRVLLALVIDSSIMACGLEILKLLLVHWTICVAIEGNNEGRSLQNWNVALSTGCPSSEDVCGEDVRVHKDRITCTVTSQCLNQTLSQLPHNIIELTVVVDKFPSNGVFFSRFTSLARLEIHWKYSPGYLLHAQQNQLTDSGLFEDLGMLASLKLSIPISVMNDSLLLGLKNLKELDLSNIGFFTTSKFASLYRGSHLENKPIKHLNLRRISGVGTSQDRLFLLKELLPLFKGSNITSLDMALNREVYFHPGVSVYLPNLEHVNLHGNRIRYIDDPAEATCTFVEGLFNLKLESIDITNMGELGADVGYNGLGFFKLLKQCITRTWNRNNCICSSFNKTCGAYFTEDIDCNQFPEYTLKEFISLDRTIKCDWDVSIPLPKSLQVLRISKTQLQLIDPTFRNLTLCFQPNKFKVIDASHVWFNIHKDIVNVHGWDQLLVLDLAYSSWGYLFHNPKYLHTIPRLEVLNVSGTNIGLYIQNDTGNLIFETSHKLKILLLRSAEIYFVPQNEFIHLNNLEILDLSNNFLSHVCISVSSLVSLSFLNLSHNSLYLLTPKLTMELDELMFKTSVNINLQHNSFICDCPSLFVIRWLKNTAVKLTNKSKLSCTYKGQQEISLVAVDMQTFITECYLIYIVTCTVVGIALAIIATIGLVYKCRWKIRTTMLKLVHWKSNNDKNNEYKYNAFVVYSEEDRQWVHNILLYELETVRGMKLCVHFRDFNPGEDIDEQIVKSVDNSRKTLLILTKHFLISEWCQYEMRVARNKLQAEGKDVVVPILLAELPVEHGNPAIKNLIREKTYLRWETSLGGQDYFWEKLTFAISGISGKNSKQNSIVLPESKADDSVLITRKSNPITTASNHLRVRRSTSTYSILMTSQTSLTDDKKYGTFDNTD